MLGVVGSEIDIQVIRLHKEFSDLMCPAIISQLIQFAELHPGMSLWGSIPCTPWTTWQFLNIHKHGDSYLKRLETSREESMIMLNHFRLLGKTIISNGGSVSFEWPRFVTGWLRTEVITMMHEFQMYSAVFNGCAVGLTDDSGVPVKKPWRVVTTSPQLAKALSTYTCSCAEKHSPLEGGQKASKSAFYPRKLALKSFLQTCSLQLLVRMFLPCQLFLLANQSTGKGYQISNPFALNLL